MLHVSVTDTGEAFPRNMHGKLLRPFHRLGMETTNIKGTDIGLTITKHLIERMDGHIGVDSEIGKGSTFWIELPLAERIPIDEAVADRKTVDDGAELRPDVTSTVLYVEDNPASLDLMKVIVARIEGCSMISGHNCRTGHRTGQEQYPRPDHPQYRPSRHGWVRSYQESANAWRRPRTSLSSRSAPSPRPRISQWASRPVSSNT